MHEPSVEWLRHPSGHDLAGSTKFVQILLGQLRQVGIKGPLDLVWTEPSQRPNDNARGSLWHCQSPVWSVSTPHQVLAEMQEPVGPGIR